MRGARRRGWRWVPAFILWLPYDSHPTNPTAQVVAIQEAAQQLDEAPAS